MTPSQGTLGWPSTVTVGLAPFNADPPHPAEQVDWPHYQPPVEGENWACTVMRVLTMGRFLLNAHKTWITDLARACRATVELYQGRERHVTADLPLDTGHLARRGKRYQGQGDTPVTTRVKAIDMASRWICSCGYENFGKRRLCKHCNLPRQDHHPAAAALATEADASSSGAGVRTSSASGPAAPDYAVSSEADGWYQAAATSVQAASAGSTASGSGSGWWGGSGHSWGSWRSNSRWDGWGQGGYSSGGGGPSW